jgi:hypothetical protein
MTAVSHLEALQRRHRHLDQKIDEEMQHPSRDALVISALKRKKLEIKDEIARLERESRH